MSRPHSLTANYSHTAITPKARLAQSSKAIVAIDTRLGIHPAYRLYLDSLSPSGRRPVASMLRRVIDVLNINMSPNKFPWHTIDFEMLETARASLKKAGYAARSINMAMAAVRSIVRIAFQLGMTDADSVMRVSAIKNIKPKGAPSGRSLTSTEIKRLTATCRQDTNRVRGIRDEALLLVGLAAGLRVSELASLDINDICIDSGRIEVLSGKGDQYREVHVSTKANNALKRWLRYIPNTGSIWYSVNKSGAISASKLTSSGISHALSRLASVTNIPHFSPHDLRRTFITLLLDQGVDINSVRLLAGHADISTTSIYDRRNRSVLRCLSRGLKLGEPVADYSYARTQEAA